MPEENPFAALPFAQKLEAFLAFEKEEDLFALQYNRVFFWQLMRVGIFNGILGTPDGSTPQNEASDNRAKGWPVQTVTNSARMAVLSCLRRPARADLFVCARYARRLCNGVYINPYTYFLDEIPLGKQAYTCYGNEWPARPVPGLNNAGVLFGWLAEGVVRRVRRKLGVRPKPDPAVDRLAAALRQRFGLCTPPAQLLWEVAHSTQAFLYYKKHFRRLLKTGYGCVYLEDHYSVQKFALIAAAHELGLPVVEHQHGSIGRYHWAYNYGDLRPKGKYLPDWLFTFGQYWSETCRLPKGFTPRAVGYPFMDDSRAALRDVPREDKTVLFYPGNAMDEPLTALAVELAALAAPYGYTVKCKIHPLLLKTWRNAFPRLAAANNVEVIDRSVSVHEYLAAHTHHVSVSSTVLFEALAFGGRAYTYAINGTCYMDDMVARGYMQRFHSARELLCMILGEAGKPMDRAAAEAVYQSGSLQNLEAALRQISGAQVAPEMEKTTC